MDMVRRALEEARGAARSQGKDVGRGRVTPAQRSPPSDGGAAWSDRAPMPAIPRLSVQRLEIWHSRAAGPAQVAEGSVPGQWATVVGDQIADHATPVSLRDGVLTVSAESTAWATQLRMVQAQLLAKIAAAVGDGVVTSMKIQGRPRHRGARASRHVPGRGPRDTYG